MYSQKDQESKPTTQCLKLRWALGLNFEIMDGMHNLTNSHRKQVFYAVGNTGVIYNYSNQGQRLLQGHCNMITSTAFCRQKDILITADSGEESMLVVWDAFKGVPLKTIFNPHTQGVCAIDITTDGRYIVSLSKVNNQEDWKNGKRQQVSLWDWQNNDQAVNSVQIRMPQFDQKYIKFGRNQAYLKMNCVRFNNSQELQFATTGPKYVLFWKWDQQKKGLQFYSQTAQKAFQQLTQTIFIPSSTQAVTGTNHGIIIVWDVSFISDDFDQPSQRKHMKRVHLMNTSSKGTKKSKDKILSTGKQKNPAINILKIQGKHLVVGSSNGSVRFYDFQYRIVAWFQDIDIGSITSVSFSSAPPIQKPGKQKSQFNCPDFIVVDNQAKVTLLTADHYQQIQKQDKKGTILMQSIVSPIVATAVRPNSSTLVISCQNAKVYFWNFQDKRSIIQQVTVLNLQNDQCPTCLNYSPNSKFLSVATAKGLIKFLQIDKNDVTPVYVAEIQKSHPVITMQVFSSDSRHLATMDKDYGVALFILQDRWQIAGKIRVHHDTIRSISFGQFLDQKGQPKLRLYSIAQDMKMAQYQVVDTKKGQDDPASKFNKLRLKAIYPIQHECNPTACIWYPINLYKQNVLLVVNQQYKLKLWNMLKDNLKICKRTCLGPTYGGQITKLLILNPMDQKNIYQDKYLAYATQSKVVGIIKMPLDGNPNNTLGLIAHPTQITGISSTIDGKLFFTSGSYDYCVNIWQVNIPALEQNFTVPPQHNPFPDLLQGGPDGAIRDLKDFFYYSQIRSKDEHSTKARKLDGKVPLQAIPNMMRSMGYYPTLKQIENMQNQIKYSKYLQNYGQPTTQLDLDAFLRLFVNHRPVRVIDMTQIQSALATLNPGKYSIGRQQLIAALMNEGQKMTQQQIDQAQQILMGEGNLFPQTIDVDTLCHKVLGFQDMDKQQTPQPDTYS